MDNATKIEGIGAVTVETKLIEEAKSFVDIAVKSVELMDFPSPIGSCWVRKMNGSGELERDRMQQAMADWMEDDVDENLSKPTRRLHSQSQRTTFYIPPVKAFQCEDLLRRQQRKLPSSSTEHRTLDTGGCKKDSITNNDRSIRTKRTRRLQRNENDETQRKPHAGSKQNAIDEGNTSTSKEPRTSTAEPGQERLEEQPTEQAQQPHQEQIEEEQPAQAEGVDSPEQTDAEDETTRADDDGLKIRAFPKILTKAVEQLSPAQRQAVKDIGLGSLLDLQITNLPHQMGLWLVENFDPRSCTLQLQNGQTIHITADDVAAVLGLPKGNIEITKRKAKAMPEILKE
nr:uncharacterized protein LOC109191529 [Ipomoea batatas]